MKNSLDQNFMQKLDFTDTKNRVAELIAYILEHKDDNNSKLQFIKEEISSGRFQIQNEKIADKLLPTSVLEEI